MELYIKPKYIKEFKIKVKIKVEKFTPKISL